MYTPPGRHPHRQIPPWADTPPGETCWDTQPPFAQCMLGYPPTLNRILDTRLWKHYLSATSFLHANSACYIIMTFFITSFLYHVICFGRPVVTTFAVSFDKGARIQLFLGGLSLHLNHLIASRTANYDWPFGTLPFGLFGWNLDTRDLETYPRTYSGHFWNM